MSLGLKLNQNVLQSLLRDLQENLLPAASGPFAACGMDIELMEAWLRLLRLSKASRDIPALAPAYEREILYRVLMGPQGGELRQLGQRESDLSRISQIVKWFRSNFMRPIDIGELASKSGMAINTFHRQFKRATGLSPIQFQKAIKAPGGQKPYCLRGLSGSKCCIPCRLSESFTVQPRVFPVLRCISCP